MSRQSARLVVKKEMTERESWARVVSYLLGVRFVGESKEARRSNALGLASAALIAAGEPEMAAKALEARGNDEHSNDC